MKAPLAALVLCGLLPWAGLRAASPSPARHVVVVVFDGMRPDFVSEATTPELWRLAHRGASFAHHHPVFCSATEVNGTAIATGVYPEHSFAIANYEYRPLIQPLVRTALEDPPSVARGDEATGGHYLGAPTVAELVHAQGWTTAIAGAKQVTLLHDRGPRTRPVSPVLFEGATFPAGLAADLARVLGPFPALQADHNKRARDAWTTQALLHHFWQADLPAFSLLWLAEPDISQHWSLPGSPQSLAGIKSSDANLGLVLAELDRRGLRDSTDVFVISDHGFSTISHSIDLAEQLAAAGFPARRVLPHPLRLGELMVVGSGGSSLLYVGGHDLALTRRLAAWLQASPDIGVIFSRGALPGTFPLAEAHIASPEAPDLLVSLRWTGESNSFHTPGLSVSDFSEGRIAHHAGLSAFDMHNILFAAGPDIRPGFVDHLPSGNLDLAPTVLWLLGLKSATTALDGRVLTEALRVEGPALRSNQTRRLTAQSGRWKQYLQVSEVNGVRYLDEGNGELSPP